MPRKKTTEKAAPAPNKSAFGGLDAALGQLDKVFGKKADNPLVDIDPGLVHDTLPHMSTGSFVVDHLIGGEVNMHGVPPCPGWPRGRIVNLYGHESSGKTTLALATAADVTAKGGQVAFIDYEHAVSIPYAKDLGVPVDDASKFRLFQPTSMEDGLKVLKACCDAGVDLIVLDSVGAPVPKSVRDQKLRDKGKRTQLGEVAFLWSQNLPDLQVRARQTGSLILGLAQLRKTMNSMPGAPDAKPQGGEAWKFYSSVRIMLKRVGGDKGKVFDAIERQMVEKFITNRVKVVIEKCKVAPTQKNFGHMYIRYGEGVDNVRSAIEVAERYGIIDKAGTWMEFANNGEKVRAQGLSQFRFKLLSTPNAWNNLYGQARAALQVQQKNQVLSEGGVDLDDVEF